MLDLLIFQLLFNSVDFRSKFFFFSLLYFWFVGEVWVLLFGLGGFCSLFCFGLVLKYDFVF